VLDVDSLLSVSEVSSFAYRWGGDLEEGLVAVTEEDSEEAAQYKRLV